MFRFFQNAKRSLDSLLNLITDLVADGLLFFRLLFRSRTALSGEILFLRKQLAFYEERQVRPRRLNDSARFSLILWSRLCNWKEALVIVKPETLIGWHRKGFQLFWKGKSQAGRPRIPENIRKLIVQMAQENPTWGQARVAAELSVKLGIYVSPRTVRAYWPPEPERRGRRRTSSQNWKTFVRNHDPVHRRLRFPGRGDCPVSNSLCVPPNGGRDTAHRTLQRHCASNGSLDLAAASRSDSERSFLPFPDP
jgi:putative transposase